MFNPSILELQSQIHYYQEQQELAEQELDRLKMTQAFAEDAVEKVEEALEHIDPKYVDVFREHLLSLFPTSEAQFSVENRDRAEVSYGNAEAPISLEEDIEVIDSTAVEETKPQKEFGSLSYYELKGVPDLRPDTFEDLAPHITYSSGGKAYVGFHDRVEAEEFRNSISEPSLLDDAVIMNGFKYEVKLYCTKEFIEDIVNDWTPEQKEELDWQEQLVRIAPDVFYDPSQSKCYVGFSAKGRCDSYGSYLTRILDIAEKYIVSAKPTVTTNTKYELVLEQIELDSAQHLSKFNLKKEYDAKQNKEARQLWSNCKRIHPPACRPSDKLVPLDQVKLGDIVYLNSIDNQYKVLQKVELDGQSHIEVICVYNSERSSLTGLTSYLRECYLVPVDRIQIDPQFQEEEEVITEDVNIYIPENKTAPVLKQEPLTENDFPVGPYTEIPLTEVEFGDIISSTPYSKSAYVVKEHKGEFVMAECIYHKSLPGRVSQEYSFSKIYLVEKATEEVVVVAA